MEPLHAIAAFSIAAGLATMTPGLDTALVLRTAAVEGRRRAMQCAAGIALGCLAWGVTVSVGLGALLAASQFAYAALRVAGGLYVLWLGGRLVVAAFRRAKPMTSAPAPSATRSWLWRGFLTNILNPKVGVFYVTLLPLFVPAHANVTAFSILLASIHAGEALIWFGLLTRLTASLGSWVQRRGVTRALDGITGSVLIAFGVGLFLQRR
jgi:threonine/homoserine/homoserine lactone efflux protein